MARFRTIIASTLYCALVLLACPLTTSRAYLDPGTGSYLIQVLVAGLLAAGLAVRLFWRNITGFLRRLFPRRDTVGEEAPHER